MRMSEKYKPFQFDSNQFQVLSYMLYVKYIKPKWKEILVDYKIK